MIRILLVEDDPVIRDTTSYFLKCQQNFEVVCADTGGLPTPGKDRKLFCIFP